MKLCFVFQGLIAWLCAASITETSLKSFMHSSRLSMLPFSVIAGNWITASAHIVTAVIGSGVLSLAWAIAQMGWVAGPVILFLFAAVTWYMSLLLADAYRNPRDTGKRNYTYPGAVSAILGERLTRFKNLEMHVCVSWWVLQMQSRHASNDFFLLTFRSQLCSL